MGGALNGIRACWHKKRIGGRRLTEILGWEKNANPMGMPSVYNPLGASQEDATERGGISFEIVNWLRSPSSWIRDLAYYWVVHLVGGESGSFRRFGIGPVVNRQAQD